MEKQRLEIHISTWSMLKIVLFLAGVWFVLLIKETLAIVFVSLILASVLSPAVKMFREKFRFEANISIITVYFLVIIFFGAAFYLLIPPMIEQAQQMALVFPKYWEDLINLLAHYNISVDQLPKDVDMSVLSQGFASTAKSVLTGVSTILGGLVSFFVVLAVTYFLLLEKDATRRVVRYILPDTYIPVVVRIVNRIQEKIGHWVRAQIILGMIVGFLTYIGLVILGVKYALLLAFIAAVTEFIPYVGPMLAVLPAIFIASTSSIPLVIAVIALYVIIQRLENMIIVPKVMQKAVGLNPVISIVALLIGAQVGGMVGIILAIPVATAISVIIKELLHEKESV